MLNSLFIVVPSHQWCIICHNLELRSKGRNISIAGIYRQTLVFSILGLMLLSCLICLKLWLFIFIFFGKIILHCKEPHQNKAKGISLRAKTNNEDKLQNEKTTKATKAS